MYAKNQILTKTISSNRVNMEIHVFTGFKCIEGRQSIRKPKKTWHYKIAMV